MVGAVSERGGGGRGRWSSWRGLDREECGGGGGGGTSKTTEKEIHL